MIISFLPSRNGNLAEFAKPSDRVLGAGEMADLIRRYDWSRTALGAISGWSETLVGAVNMILAAPIPMQLMWGPEMVILYNDGLMESIADKHPSALGGVARRVWADAWPTVGPQLEGVFLRAEAVSAREVLVPLLQNGETVDTYWDYSYSPVYNTDGTIAGILDVAQETTRAVIAKKEAVELYTQLRQIQEVTTDYILGIDRDWRISYMNPSSYQSLRPAGAEVGQMFWETFSDAIYEGSPYVYHYHRAMEQGISAEFEASYGAPLFITINVSVRPTSNGIVLFSVDVTEKRKVEREREAQAALQASLIELSTQLRESDSPELMLRFVSDLVCKTLKVERAGLCVLPVDTPTSVGKDGSGLGKGPSAPDLLDPERVGPGIVAQVRAGTLVAIPDVRTDTIAQGATLAENGIFSLILVPLTQHGRWHAAFCISHTQPRTWTEQEISFCRQVADAAWVSVQRARGQEELRVSEESLRIASELTHLGHCRLDPATGTLLSTTATFKANFGRGPDEAFTHVDLLASIHPEDVSSVRSAVRRAVANNETYQSEYRVLWPDGTQHWISARGRLVHFNDGRAPEMEGVTLNVSERHQSQAALVQNEKLAIVGRLAASIAHEINNPLESVTNLLYLARRSQESLEIQEYLDTAERELRRVSLITNQTLRFHRQSTSPSLHYCYDLIEDSLSIYQGRLVNAGIEVEKRKLAKRPILCFGGEIRQVLSNLIGNATDAMPLGGRLFIRSREATYWKTGQRGLVIIVADTGTGISLATQKKIFEPFFTTKGIGGTGLGLWISCEIVARHHGALRVRSSQKEGHSGTVFALFLPFDFGDRQTWPLGSQE